MRSKGLISLNFGYHVNFKVFKPNYVLFSQIKDRKHIEYNFHSVAGGHAPWVGLGGAVGVKNFSVGICDGALSTVHSSFYFNLNLC